MLPNRPTYLPGDILFAYDIDKISGAILHKYYVVLDTNKDHFKTYCIYPEKDSEYGPFVFSDITGTRFELMDNCFNVVEAPKLKCTCDFYLTILPHGCRCGGI